MMEIKNMISQPTKQEIRKEVVRQLNELVEEKVISGYSGVEVR